jgi:hypothetical protein
VLENQIASCGRATNHDQSRSSDSGRDQKERVQVARFDWTRVFMALNRLDHKNITRSRKQGTRIKASGFSGDRDTHDNLTGKARRALLLL